MCIFFVLHYSQKKEKLLRSFMFSKFGLQNIVKNHFIKNKALQRGKKGIRV